MQHFVNRAAIERALSKLYSGANAHLWLTAVMAACVAGATGLTAGAIWLGAALLVAETYKTLSGRVSALASRRADLARMALDITSSASLAAAPAIVWVAQTQASAALAALMLAALALNTTFAATRGRIRTVIACAPYGMLGLFMLAEAGLAQAAALALVGGYVFAAALHHAHRARHARRQDIQWLQHLNMGFADPGAAAWEVDFVAGRLIGADRLGDLLGRPVNFTDVTSATFAAPADRALVQAALAPARGGARRVALEHELIDGSRVRHVAFVRTTPDGDPISVACVTRMSAAESARQPAQDEFASALAAQAQCLKTLNNELSTTLMAHAATGASSAALLEAQQHLISQGIDALSHARHAAEAANLAKSQFLANMSHELRTPLNAIIGYTEMLLEDSEDSGDDTNAQDLRRILTAAKHLLELLNEILDLSKIEAGRMDVAPSAFNPSDLLDELVKTIGPLAKQNGNALRWVGEAQEAVTDSMKLRQCLLNLLSNACKFTKGGEIEMILERRPGAWGDELSFTVRDTGIGMSSEQVSRLFQPFVQADPSITQQYGGTGLGLTITRRLAQLLGGDVSVESERGRGSIFTLTIPAHYAEALALQGPAATVDALQGAEESPLVIVIEDEPDARELAARALTRAGFAVQGVGGGEAGLSLARAKAPALVLLDIFLPDRSGWRVLQSLKNDPNTQDIPVVVLSVSEDRAHAMALGAAEHIVKPADRDRLAATVMRYARKRPAMMDDASATATASARG